MMKLKARKGLVSKSLVVLLAMLSAVTIFFILSASAASVSDGVDKSSVDEDGKVYVSFPAQSEPLYLIVFHEATPNDYVEIAKGSVTDPTSGKVEYQAIDFSTVHGGESVVRYFAVIPQEDYDDYVDDFIAKTVEPSGDNVIVKWERADQTEGSFILTKETITRSISIRNATAINTTVGAMNQYAVKAGDTVTVSVESNTADANISAPILGGAPFTFTKSATPSADGYYTYTSEVIVPAGSLPPNEIAPLAFSFTVDGVAVNHDSDAVNTGAPAGIVLTQYAPINENDLVAMVSVDTLMEDGYFTEGTDDVITLTYGGIGRELNFTVSKLVVGNRTYAQSEYSEFGQGVTFYLDGRENFDDGDDLSGVTLKILDEVGDEYTVTISNGDDFSFVSPMSGPGTYTLNILGTSDTISGPPPLLVAFSGDEITYSLKAEDIYANAEYFLELKVGSTIYELISMDLVVNAQGNPAGNPIDGYTYKAVVDIGGLSGISQNDEIVVNKIIRGATPISTIARHPDISATTIKLLMGLQYSSIEYDVLHSTHSNELGAVANTVYAVCDDIVLFEAVLTSEVKAVPYPEVKIAGVVGDRASTADIAAYIADPETFIGGCKFILDTTGTKITGIVKIPDQNTSDYNIERSIVLEVTAGIQGLDSARPTILSTNTLHQSESGGPFNDLTFWAPVNSTQFGLTMTSNSSLDNPYITKGDQVRLEYTGINASKIKSIEAGDRSVTPSGNPSFPSGNARFNLSQNNTEGFTSGDPISIALVVEHTSGKTFRIDMAAGDAFIYIVRPAVMVDDLTVAFTNAPLLTDTSPSHYAVSEYSTLSFEFYTNEVYKREYAVKLTIASGTDINVPLSVVTDPMGSPQTGYSYTGSLDMSTVSGIKDFEVIGISMTCDSSTLTFTDNLAGAEIMYYGPFTLLGLNVSFPGSNGALVWEPTDEYAYIVDGDFIKITLRFNHSLVPNDTVITMDNVTGVQGEKAALEAFINRPYDYKVDKQLMYFFDEDQLPNDTVVCIYRVPKLSDENYDQLRLSFQRENKDVYDYDDNVPMSLTVSTTRAQVPGRAATVRTGDFGPEQDAGGNEKYHQMLYWAPLDIWNPEVTLLNLGPDDELRYDDLDEETYVIVRDGQDIRISFATKHRVLVDQIVTKFSPSGTSSREAPEIDITYTENQDGQSLFVYTASFTIGKDPVSNIDDQTIIKFIWDITDARNQKTGNIKYSDETKWAIYYKPLEISEVTITTSNRKDETQFCKDEDTITVSYMANHYVIMEGHTIIDHPGEYAERRRRHREPVEYSFTYEIQNGDLEDLEFVTFAFSVADLAGDAFDFTDESPDVANRIKYYAPLEVTADIESNNTRPEFARNGDTVTISTTSNHEAQTLDFRLGSREIGDNETYREDPTVSYRIPEGEEEMYEGDLFFSVRLEDPAGNYELVSETAPEGEEGTKVTYDRTPPEIKILPGFNGFTNQDVGFTFMYTDMHLDLGTVSCILNDKERIYSAGTNTSYSHTVELSEEGEYVVSAVAIDLAGNEMEFAAVCNLIIDKTQPIIKMQLGRNTFKSGFTLDQITDIIEDNLGNMVCTITDNEGVHDWSLDLPIDAEGKKTVYTMLRDMAGNTSTPITYDIFIDGTAPQPQIINTANSEQFQAESRNFFVGTVADMAISLAPIFMGDEGPDKFTTLQLIDINGNVVFDFLSEPTDEHSFTHRLAEYGNYTLLVVATDDVGNETGPLLYMIEFREQYLLERLLENTPLAGLAILRYISDPIFYAICAAFVLLVAGIVFLVIWRRRKKKQYMAQEYVIVDDD